MKTGFCSPRLVYVCAGGAAAFPGLLLRRRRIITRIFRVEGALPQHVVFPRCLPTPATTSVLTQTAASKQACFGTLFSFKLDSPWFSRLREHLEDILELIFSSPESASAFIFL